MSDPVDARFAPTERDQTHDRHKHIRDAALVVLRKKGEPMYLSDIAAEIGVSPIYLGRTVNKFTRTFEVDRPEHGHNSRKALVAIHRHLAVA